LAEIIAASNGLNNKLPSDIWQVSSYLESRIELIVKAMSVLTSSSKNITLHADEVQKNAGVKLLQLERNLEGALRDREGTKSALTSKDRAIGELEKRVRNLEAEKRAVEETLRMTQSGEGTRIGDLQRMVEQQAYELSNQECSLAEATRHWMNHETATDNLQETTQKLISIITTALTEEPSVRDEDLNGLVLVGPTDVQGLEERIFREYDHFHTATYHMLEEVVRLLCDRAHALNLSAGKTFEKLLIVTEEKEDALRKMSQARDQLDRAELRNAQLEAKRVEMGRQLGWLDTEPKDQGNAVLAIQEAVKEENEELRSKVEELEERLEEREALGDQIDALKERLKDMATAGVSAVAAARAAKVSIAMRQSNGYEEDKQGEDEDIAGDVYDELAKFQENLANLEEPISSSSLEFAVLATGFVVQTLSHELLAQDLTAKFNQVNQSTVGNGESSSASKRKNDNDGMDQHELLAQQLALYEQDGAAEADSKIKELKSQVSALGDQLKAQTSAAAAAKAALRESELNHLMTDVGRSGSITSSPGKQEAKLKTDLDQKKSALRSLEEERDRLESELSEALEKVSSMSMSQEAGGDIKRIMELENKIADLEEEMENPKALSIHRASQAHKFIDEAEDIESHLEDIDPEDDPEEYEALEHRLKELTDHISLLLNDILAYLKGDVLRLVPSELKALTQVVMTCKDRQMCVKVFKEAHLFAKQIITEAAGHKAKLGRNSHWDFDPDLLENVAERRWAEMMKHLKRLVIAYDNMPTDMRGDLLTFREIIKNLDWLVIMSFHSVEVEEKRRDKAKKRMSSSDGRNSSDDVSSYAGRGGSTVGGGGGGGGGGRHAPSVSGRSMASTDMGANDAFDTASMASYGSVGSRGSTRSFAVSGTSTTGGFNEHVQSLKASGRRRGPGSTTSSKASPYAAFAAASEEQKRRSSAM
jgi:DNA repair exonuclease SbcCD ATPase subunit